jgi:hypothetical protein
MGSQQRVTLPRINRLDCVILPFLSSFIVNYLSISTFRQSRAGTPTADTQAASSVNGTNSDFSVYADFSEHLSLCRPTRSASTSRWPLRITDAIERHTKVTCDANAQNSFSAFRASTRKGATFDWGASVGEDSSTPRDVMSGRYGMDFAGTRDRSHGNSGGMID